MQLEAHAPDTQLCALTRVIFDSLSVPSIVTKYDDIYRIINPHLISRQYAGAFVTITSKISFCIHAPVFNNKYTVQEFNNKFIDDLSLQLANAKYHNVYIIIVQLLFYIYSGVNVHELPCR